MDDHEIPNGLPDEFDAPSVDPDAPPPNYSGAMSINVGFDKENALLILGISGGGKKTETGLPIVSAMQLAHSINAKCLEFLMQDIPPMDEPLGDGPQILLPDGH